MDLYSGGLISGRIFASEIWWAYFRDGFFFVGGGGLLSECYGTNNVKVTDISGLQFIHHLDEGDSY